MQRSLLLSPSLLGSAWILPMMLVACGDGANAPSFTNGEAGGGGGAAGTGGNVAGSGGAGTGGDVAGSGGAGTGGDVAGSGGAGTGGDGGTGGSAGAPASFQGPIGWASVTADGQDGTYGGRDGDTVDVSGHAELVAALAGTAPRIVRVHGQITGDISIGSNKTVEGVDGAVINGSISVESVQNVIVRNLTVVGKNCTDSSMCQDGDDAIGVRASHHVWFDHLDVSDGSDGNLDITQASDYVTVSWSKFWYSNTSRDHRFSNLIGSDDNIPTDEGKLKVTWHHNWWADNADQRMPRSRYGLIHVFNNLYASAGNSYCANAGFQASLLVENNVFQGVNSPHTVTQDGNLLSRGNVYDDGVTGSRDETGMAFDPPYDYAAATTDDLVSRVTQGAGPQ